MSMTFTYTTENNYDSGDATEITHKILGDDITLEAALEAFEAFLKGSGYFIEGQTLLLLSREELDRLDGTTEEPVSYSYPTMSNEEVRDDVEVQTEFNFAQTGENKL